MQNAFMNVVDQDMADRLREARTLAGFSEASEAVERFGFVYSTYMNHEGGHRGFAREARRYSNLFKVSLVWLMTGLGEPRPKDADHPILRLWEEVPPDSQPEVIEFMKFKAAKGRQA